VFILGINDFFRFGDKLKEKRKELSLTQEQMADKLGLKTSTYGNYETNKREPNSETIKNIADKLGMDVDDFFKNNSDINIDDDIRRIERAKSKMPKKQQEKFMNILNEMFEEYFDDEE
jgi:transcriptional regulator with XRE-family HTH domain